MPQATTPKIPDHAEKSQQNTERSYTNQSRKEVPSDHDYDGNKSYAQNKVSVPEFATDASKALGEPKESPQLHQKVKPGN